MSNTDPNNTTNPMKKRYRSWQPSPDESPKKTRRYPRLVVRDRTGNHIANDILTAPKVELQKKPVLPRSITVPVTPVSKPNNKVQEIGMNQTSPSRAPPTRALPTRMDSLMCSTSTKDRGAQQIESQPTQPCLTSPPLAKPTPVNAPEAVMARMSPREAGCPVSREDDIAPHQLVHAPVPPARVNPVLTYYQYPSTPERRNQCNQRPRPTAGYVPPHDVSLCTPTPSIAPMAPHSAQRGTTYAAHPGGSSAPHLSGQSVSLAVHASPQRSAMYASQAPGQVTQLAAPEPARAPAPIGSDPSDGNRQSEKVILAGKRCGTVEYWRSSLQMPREKGVVKSLKALAPPIKRRAKQGTPEGTMAGMPTHATLPQHSTSVPSRPSSGYVGGYASAYAASYTPQRPVQVAGNGVQSPRPLPQSPRLPDTEIEHEFWRSATKLPRANAESKRVKKLANGRRRIDSASLGYLNNSHETNLVRPMSAMTVTGSPGSGRQYGSAQQTGLISVGMQTENVAQAPSSIPGAAYTGAPTPASQTMQASRQLSLRPGAAQPDRFNRAKAESETRRLLFLRDFELRRLRTLAQSKFHVKMNLRGRMKLEQWVCSDSVAMAASELIVTLFNLDRRVLSRNDDTRRNALYDMTNEDLRILEALMSRIRSRGGRTNWVLLTSSLSYERFIKTLPSTEQM